MYPYYKKPCDVENAIKFLQEVNSNRSIPHCRINDGLFWLESIIIPKAFSEEYDEPNFHITKRKCGFSMKNITVPQQDYIVIFSRIYGYGQQSYDDDEKYAICLLTEIHDIHYLN